MIQYLSSQGGASLNYSIVGSTQQPAGKENRIWVNTDQPITGHIFSAEEPSNPTEGLVWFKTGSDSVVSFSATKKNPIIVYPQTCQQLISDVWVTKVARSYINGNWVDWTLILFSLNNYHEEVTGGYQSKGVKFSTNDTGTSVTISINNDGQLETTKVSSGTSTASASSHSGSILTKNKINLTSFTKINIDITAITETSGNAGATNRCFIYVTDIENTFPTDDEMRKQIYSGGAGTHQIIDNLDISNLTGDYYVCIGLRSTANELTTQDSGTIKIKLTSLTLS